MITMTKIKVLKQVKDNINPTISDLNRLTKFDYKVTHRAVYGLKELGLVEFVANRNSQGKPIIVHITLRGLVLLNKRVGELF